MVEEVQVGLPFRVPDVTHPWLSADKIRHNDTRITRNARSLDDG